MRRVRRVHMVGIGGTGMCGIAEVLVNLGFEVSGSDLADSAATRHLQKLGVTLHRGHDAAHLGDADVLVTSSAVPEDNPEVAAARTARVPVVPRAQMLSELMRFRRGIAIAGTHGKTTTTSLTASLLAEAGEDPTFVIGGVLNAWGSNARLGQGEYLVAEADESDGSFLLLQPVVALVTNIDRDHLETYGGRFDRLREAFDDFLQRLPFYGAAVLCADDPEAAALAARAPRAVVTYGLSEGADVRADNVRQDGRKMIFDAWLPGAGAPFEVTLNLPGVHNVRNALGALAIAWELGLDARAAARCFATFEGVGRRFSALGDVRLGGHRVPVVEDYGHHPTELAATLAAARGGWPDARLVVVFQPHRYTRTRDLFDDFSRVLAEADVLVLTEIYAAGEPPIEGVDAAALCQSIRARGKVDPILVPALDQLAATLDDLARPGDLVLLLGAGSMDQVASDLRRRAANDANAGEDAA
ncbi:UDP-N-acetylmuramate--L-alanine ligase [Marinihelvus fidelis]|uniref:UDP-N-acetylmuramate--L-alanine ligase n=2 Tax=Marinihelvus fidelis TaxID=2613842 RepID=A0A5N0T7G9_9GAMM|nr:UDP-N-acetylmuramate--L-alanine ligase [Marinihelvus fidelis]KAA9129766.1 UDP-N-acetylmuramate--L-alanine ligase [Marinihelvus fidelis]